MVSATELILYFLILLVVAVLVLYLLINGVSSRAFFISSRLDVASDTLQSLANSALSEAQSIIGQAFDFANIIVDDINRVLQAISQSIAQIITTLGQALVDVINFIASYFEASNAALVSEINGFFNGLVYPIFDTIEQSVRTIITIGNALYQTFNPSTC